MKNNLAVIILAAGKSTRMKSSVPKVLHPICGRPMLDYVLDLVKGLAANKIITVIGHQYKEVAQLIRPGIKVVIQKQLLGTADAVKQAGRLLKNFRGTVLVLYADNPLLKKETINNLLKHHRENNLDATLLTSVLDNPTGYGRILRDKYYSICGIAEEKDADGFQKDIKEVNTGIACFDSAKLFNALKYVRPNNRKNEYYLTDTVGIIYKNGGLIDGVTLKDVSEAHGINSRIDLARANKIMQQRINEEFMSRGVTIVDPGSTFIGAGAKIGTDTTIYPFTVIENNVKIGKRCLIGPFAHLRESTVIKDGVLVGNFLEIVRSRINPKTIIKHFCYIGDARVGSRVNIGAGTVVANFDGRRKHPTVIGNGAFIGSDTVLVAPVEVGKYAITGAGSAVINNVAARSTVVGVPARKLLKNNRISQQAK